jgi:hypothetical protein
VSTYRLGIDFGTSHTVAVLQRPDGRVEPLLFDSSPLLISAVYAEPNGRISVGRDAMHSARIEPGAYEPHPKRRVDDHMVLLGPVEFPVSTLIAAVLSRVEQEATRVIGRPADQVVMTCPAGWGAQRRGLLVEAARAAGLGTPHLVPEPLAAACYFSDVLGHRVPVGGALVVYDFGAGTFDAAVVRRGAEGWEVLAVDGLNDVGGLDLDSALVDSFRARVGPEHAAAWARLVNPQNVADRRYRRMLWDDVRAAKEKLSRSSSAGLPVPLLDIDLHATRESFEELARPWLERTMATTAGAVARAGVSQYELAGVLLAGGSSRIPLVATLLHQRFGLAPTVTEQPELVVAQGSLLAVSGGPAAQPMAAAAMPAGPMSAGMRGAPMAAGMPGAPMSAGMPGAPMSPAMAAAPMSGPPAAPVSAPPRPVSAPPRPVSAPPRPVSAPPRPIPAPPLVPSGALTGDTLSQPTQSGYAEPKWSGQASAAPPRRWSGAPDEEPTLTPPPAGRPWLVRSLIAAAVVVTLGVVAAGAAAAPGWLRSPGSNENPGPRAGDGTDGTGHIGAGLGGSTDPKPSASTSSSAHPLPKSSSHPAVPPPGPGPVTETTFLHTASGANINGCFTFLSNPMTDGNPYAVILVTHFWNPAGGLNGTYNDHPLGVYFNGDRWAVFNEDAAVMPAGAAFAVHVYSAPTATALAQVAGAGATGDWAPVDSPAGNGKPAALVSATVSWGPPAGPGGIYHNHPTGVFYAGEKWAVFNEDQMNMPANAAFNVVVGSKGARAGFVHTASAANKTANYTDIDNPATNGHPNARLFVTQSWGNHVYNPHNVGVWYHDGKWSIYSEDNDTPIPDAATFTVLVYGG